MKKLTIFLALALLAMGLYIRFGLIAPESSRAGNFAENALTIMSSEDAARVLASRVSKKNNEEKAPGSTVDLTAAGGSAAPGLLCLKTGPFSPRELPKANKAIKEAGFLDRSLVEDILSDDAYVVYLVPTTTAKGAQALARQAKQKGYKDAAAITSGPLANATRLGVFSSEEEALAFMQKASDRLDTNGVRTSRVMGEPTGNVFLVFKDLSGFEAKKLHNEAARLGKDVRSCVPAP